MTDKKNGSYRVYFHDKDRLGQGLDFSYTHTPASDLRAFECHCHETYEIFYLFKGEGVYIVEDAAYPLFPHMLLFIRPCEYHCVRLVEGCEYERCTVNFDSGILPTLDGDYLLLHKNHSVLYDASEVDPLLPSLFQRMIESGDGNLDMRRLLLGQILLMLRTPAAPEAEKASIKQEDLSADEPLGVRVLRYLNANLTSPMTLDALSAHFFVSKFHLCRAFKGRNGITVMDYLTRKRILLAKQWIAEGDSVSNVAYRVGFADYSTFFRAYRKIMGCSPTENKKQKNTKEGSVRE